MFSLFVAGYMTHTLAHLLGMHLWNPPFYRAFDPYTRNSWAGRMTAVVTQAVVLPVTAYFGGETACLHALGAYIANDMLHCSVYEPDRMNWLHHLVTFGGYVYAVWIAPELAYALVACSLLLETTAPWIHLCWFANKAGYASRPWFPYLAGWTILVYGAMRCLYFPWYVWTTVPPTLLPLGAFFTGLNWIWFVKLIGYARAVLKKAGGSRLE